MVIHDGAVIAISLLRKIASDASEAKRSKSPHGPGLLRRHAPRNDGLGHESMFKRFGIRVNFGFRRTAE